MIYPIMYVCRFIGCNRSYKKSYRYNDQLVHKTGHRKKKKYTRRYTYNHTLIAVTSLIMTYI